MPQPNDLSRSLVALDQNSTIIAVIEISQSSWLDGSRRRGWPLPLPVSACFIRSRSGTAKSPHANITNLTLRAEALSRARTLQAARSAMKS